MSYRVGDSGEIYYWDSYFTMLGLAESGHWDGWRIWWRTLIYESDAQGHIPNGNRTYYLKRSFAAALSLRYG